MTDGVDINLGIAGPACINKSIALKARLHTPEVEITMIEGRAQPVTGVVPPQVAEAILRETWPGVTDMPGVAHLAERLMRTLILAPLAWLLLAPCYFKKILPFLAKRYTLTNRRLMIRRGLKPCPSHEVALSDIDNVRIVPGSGSVFYRTATLEILSQGKVALCLPAVPDVETFRRAIVTAKQAWGAKGMPAPPTGAEKTT